MNPAERDEPIPVLVLKNVLFVRGAARIGRAGLPGNQQIRHNQHTPVLHTAIVENDATRGSRKPMVMS